MAASLKFRSFSSELCENRESEEEENTTGVFDGRMRERIVLQRLIVASPLHHQPADWTQLGAHYEKLHLRLSKQYMWDHMTGLLLIYPSCLLHIVESSRDVLLSVLKDLRDVQQQADRSLLDVSKVVFMEHNPERRLFQQWSYKTINADRRPGNAGAWRLKEEEEEEEESTENLVCTVLSALHKLGGRLETSDKAVPGSAVDAAAELSISQAVPGSAVDAAAELSVSQELLEKLMARDDLLSPRQHLQMYDSPLNISMDFGQATRSRSLTTV